MQWNPFTKPKPILQRIDLVVMIRVELNLLPE
jgi:hypothetical protein